MEAVTLSLGKTAEMGANEFPEECQIILKSLCIDDIIDSTDSVGGIICE